MQERTVEQVESWESRPFSGGFSSLHDLAEESFTGSVVAGRTWLFMLNGRVVGVFEGTIDDFEETSGTTYDAPHDSLPLLFSMKERGGESRAKYFTNDTPLEEADRTLTDANFTGYIELSENVLSGDYYVVYYGGKKLSAAFVGQSERLVTGEEAYELAVDEVGIYDVMDVSMNITEIPEPQDTRTTGAVVSNPDEEAVSNTDEDTDLPIEEAPEASEPAAPDSTAEEETAQDEPNNPSPSPDEENVPERGVEAGASEPATANDDAEPDAEQFVTEAEGDASTANEGQAPNSDVGETADDVHDVTRSSERDRSPTSDVDPDPASENRPANRSGTPSSARGRDSTGAESQESSETERQEATDGTRPFETGEDYEPYPDDGTSDDGSSDGSNEFQSASSTDEAETRDGRDDDMRPVFKEEEEWRKTRSIPALDPDESVGTNEERGTERAPRREPQPSQPTSRQQQSSVDAERLEELRSAVTKREERIDDLTDQLQDAQTERKDLAEDLDGLREERNDLMERVSNLESALQRANTQEDVRPLATDLTPEEALSGTNLFVRYESKGQPTLSALQESQVDPGAVNENLRLEHHTQFEVDDVAIEGQPFDAFLESTSQYRFVSWLLRTLPYELLESGRQSGLSVLYDVIPQIDRVEFDGAIEVQTSDGQGTSHGFDVVIRDRMGDPLVVAEFNDRRDPVRGEEMSDLIDAASTVATVEKSLAGVFYVTASFFEPDALEAAESAASTGGLLSRSNKDSFVKVARKDGYHLLLVEDRGEAYHVTVPEL